MDSRISSPPPSPTDEVWLSRLRVLLGSLTELKTELRRLLTQRVDTADEARQKELLEKIKKHRSPHN